MAVTVAVATEAATEAAEQEDDEDNEKDDSDHLKSPRPISCSQRAAALPVGNAAAIVGVSRSSAAKDAANYTADKGNAVTGASTVAVVISVAVAVTRAPTIPAARVAIVDRSTATACVSASVMTATSGLVSHRMSGRGMSHAAMAGS